MPSASAPLNFKRSTSFAVLRQDAYAIHASPKNTLLRPSGCRVSSRLSRPQIEAQAAGDTVLEAEIISTGRDLANQHEAVATGGWLEAEDGIICEDPEQWRLSRYYEIPIDIASEFQPPADSGLPERPQFNFVEGFTLSMWFRWAEIRQEQTLFSLDPALRFGVSWLGELIVFAEMADGTNDDEWSAERLTSGQWAFLALRFQPAVQRIDALLDAQRVLTLDLPKPLAEVEECFLGRFRDGSLLNGDVQDVRIYHDVRSIEFLEAEKDSYCADWVEVT